MPTIRRRERKDGSVRFHVQVRMLGFPTRTASFTTKRQAERWAKTVEAEMIEGRHFRTPEARRRSLGEAVDRYIREEIPKKRDGEMHKTTLTWWKKQLGSTKLAALSPALIVEHRGKLMQEERRGRILSGARVNRYVACLRHLFTVARREWHWIGHNPMDGVSMLPEGKGRVRYLSEAERKVLLAETKKDPKLHLFVLLALSTACRAGELQTLQWADVDLKEGRLLFRKTKNAHPRTAWISGEPLRLLKEHGKVRQIKGGLVFVPETKRAKVYQYHPPFKAAVEAAEVRDFRFHDLRHTAATYLAQAGATEQQLRAIGGWKSGIVSRYVHLAAADAKAALEQLTEKVSQ